MCFFRRLAGTAQNVARDYPYGWWRCTHVSDWCARYFEVGEIYQCRTDGIGSARIYPDDDGSWAPFWQPHNGRFCYPPSDMQFEYVGKIKPIFKEKTVSKQQGQNPGQKYDRETLVEALRMAQNTDEQPEAVIHRAKLYAQFLSQ